MKVKTFVRHHFFNITMYLKKYLQSTLHLLSTNLFFVFLVITVTYTSVISSLSSRNFFTIGFWVIILSSHAKQTRQSEGLRGWSTATQSQKVLTILNYLETLWITVRRQEHKSRLSLTVSIVLRTKMP